MNSKSLNSVNNVYSNNIYTTSASFGTLASTVPSATISSLGAITGLSGKFSDLTSSGGTELGSVSVYGNNWPPLVSALYCNGGFTVDGGLLHGASISCLPVAGVNTQRFTIDQTGISFVTPTYMSLTGLGFMSFNVGGYMRLRCGGDFSIDNQNVQIISSTLGNQACQLSVQHLLPPSDTGNTNPLLIDNGYGAGVILNNINSINGTAFNTLWFGNATTDLNMNNHNISNVANINIGNITGINNLYSTGNFNIYAPTGLAVGFNNTVYFNKDIVMNTPASLNMNYNNITNVNNIYMNNSTLYNAHELYNNNTDLLLTGITKNIILQTLSGGSIYLNNTGVNISLNTDGSMYLQTTGSNKTVYLNTENLSFTGSTNNHISGLGHIYGNPSSSGGGLTIDYMYGMFFNSSGYNANFFCDSGGLHMLNYNTVIDINAVNSDLYIGAGRTVNLNATTGANMNSGGASISIASDNNIYFTGNGGGGTTRFANFQDTNVAFNTGTAGSLSIYMNGNNIRNVGEFSRNLGSGVVSQPVIQYGTASGSGVSGTVTVTIPTSYSTRGSYIVQVTMRDAPTAQLYATPVTSSSFTIGWTSAGTGTQNIMWTTFGN